MKAKLKVIKNWEFEEFELTELPSNIQSDWMQRYGGPQRG